MILFFEKHCVSCSGCKPTAQRYSFTSHACHKLHLHQTCRCVCNVCSCTWRLFVTVKPCSLSLLLDPEFHRDSCRSGLLSWRHWEQ